MIQIQSLGNRRGTSEKGKDHHLYLLFATTEIWDTLDNFPKDVRKFFTPEPFSQEQFACRMKNTLEGELMSCIIHCINSTARTVDPLIPIKRNVNFYDVMNNYGHRGPDQCNSEHRAMGRKEFMECARIVRQGTAYISDFT